MADDVTDPKNVKERLEDAAGKEGFTAELMADYLGHVKELRAARSEALALRAGTLHENNELRAALHADEARARQEHEQIWRAEVQDAQRSRAAILALVEKELALLERCVDAVEVMSRR
jgi:hypothetical protein